MKNIMNVCALFLFLISINICFAAFSSPYLENNTIIFNGTSSYEYKIVFQNTENETRYMTLQTLVGQDWMNPPNFTVEVPPKNYDTAKVIMIKIPDKIIENGKEVDLQYNKKYEITYAVSSGDIGGSGMVPVTSQVKKKFYVYVYQQPNNWILYAQIAIVVLVLSFIGYAVYKKKKKPENNETSENNVENFKI